MLKEETEYSPVRTSSETTRGFFVSRVKALAALLLFISLVIILIVLAVLLVQQKGKQELVNGDKYNATAKGSEGEESSLKPMSCDVVVVGGGISGLYMAETVMRRNKEDNVCLFEKEPRFGGRNYDVTFSRAPNVSLMLGSWRIDTAHKKVINLARRLKVPMFKMPVMKVDYVEGRGVYASSLQSFKKKAFPTLLSGPFANMTPSEMFAYAWKNMSEEKALEVPYYSDFLCQRLGYEACVFLNEIYGQKIDYARLKSTLFSHEYRKAARNFTDEYLRPRDGISEISNALETSAKRFGVKMYARERVQELNRKEKGNMFAVHTDHFLVSAKKLIIAIPVYPFKEIIGDVASEIKSNRLFTPILPRSCFKAVAIYKYPWWENATSSHNITLKPFQRFVSSSTCLMWMMPYSGRGPQGEGIIQLTYSYFPCAVKWGELSKLPKAVFKSELRKAVEAVFPGMTVPEPLDMVFKYWKEICWHQTKGGSNVSRYDIEKWAKRPFPGEEIYMVNEAFSTMIGWNEGSLRSAYKALKEGWGIASPEP